MASDAWGVSAPGEQNEVRTDGFQQHVGYTFHVSHVATAENRAATAACHFQGLIDRALLWPLPID
jgi:hypothetical protein